jgi:hypothetical protein
MVTSPSSVQPSSTRSTAPKYTTAVEQPCFLRVVVAVELWGGLDGFLASVTLGEDESVDGGERGELCLGCGVRASDVCDTGTTHCACSQRQ